MTNHARGEASYEINGETFTLVPTLKAMAEVEAETGVPFPRLMTSMSSGVKIGHLLACAKAFARAGGAEDISAIEASTDIAQIAKAVGDCVSKSMPGKGQKKGGGAKPK